MEIKESKRLTRLPPFVFWSVLLLIAIVLAVVVPSVIYLHHSTRVDVGSLVCMFPDEYSVRVNKREKSFVIDVFWPDLRPTGGGESSADEISLEVEHVGAVEFMDANWDAHFSLIAANKRASTQMLGKDDAGFGIYEVSLKSDPSHRQVTYVKRVQNGQWFRVSEDLDSTGRFLAFRQLNGSVELKYSMPRNLQESFDHVDKTLRGFLEIYCLGEIGELSGS